MRRLMLLAVTAALLIGAGTLPAADEIMITWVKKVEDAKAQAAKEGKDLFINFTGSDWCGWCKRLDGEVFTKPEFVSKATEKYVFLYLDFPQGPEKKAEVVDPALNEQLQEKYGVRGFPTIVLATADGTVYGKTGYQPGGPEKYLEHLGGIDADGMKMKAYLKDEGADEAKTRALLAAALPVISKNSLFGFDAYTKALDQTRKLDPNNEHGLLQFVLGHEQNEALQKMMESIPRGEQPDWETLHAKLKTSEHAHGEVFVNLAWGCASWLKDEKKDPAAAKALFQRVLADPMLAGNERAMEMVNKAIAECDKPAEGAGDKPAEGGGEKKDDGGGDK